MSEKVATQLSIYTAFVEVAGAALGGKKDDNPVTEDLSGASPEHFAQRVGELLSA